MEVSSRFKIASTKDVAHVPRGPRVRWLLLLAVAMALALPSAVGLSLAPSPYADPLGASGPMTAADGADAAYTMRFDCPDVAPEAGIPAGCPAYVLDREDIMGSPRLVIDPRDPGLAAFGALHGGMGLHPVPGSEPPTGRSRDDAVHQPHTTFATHDGGRRWTDMPYHAPDSLRTPGREIYGDDHAIALDGEGRLHIAALYSYREAAAPFADANPFRSAVAVWKAHGIERPVDHHVNLKVLDPATPEARIDSLHLVGVPDADAVALVWREEGEVVLHSTRGSDGALWTKRDLGIGPCEAISNPLALGTRVLLACAANDTGPWSVHAIDASTWTSTPVGEAPLATQHALLVSRWDSFVVLVGSGVADDETPTVQLSYGEGGERWSGVEEIGPQLTRGASATPVLDARVTAAAYNPVSGNLHLVYLERYDLGQGGEQGAGRPEFYKAIASVQAEGSFQGKIDLGIGTVNRAAFSPTLSGVGGGVYDDLHDGLAIWRDPDAGGVREFVAFGDYGFVRYAEIVEENFLSPIAPLSAQVPPIPAASAGTVPVLVGVPAGILAGAMVVRSVWARRQATAEAPSE